jgi:hypothetical protein
MLVVACLLRYRAGAHVYNTAMREAMLPGMAQPQ